MTRVCRQTYSSTSISMREKAYGSITREKATANTQSTDKLTHKSKVIEGRPNVKGNKDETNQTPIKPHH